MVCTDVLDAEAFREKVLKHLAKSSQRGDRLHFFPATPNDHPAANSLLASASRLPLSETRFPPAGPGTRPRLAAALASCRPRGLPEEVQRAAEGLLRSARMSYECGTQENN